MLLTTQVLFATANAEVVQNALIAVNKSSGLPNNSVRDVVSAKDNTIWFATMSGLVQFDGNRMKVFQPVEDDPHSIISGDVYTIAQDTVGRIWIGANSRLSYLDPQTQKFFTIASQEAKCDVTVKLISLAKDDTVWAINDTGMLVRYDSLKKKLDCYSTVDRLGPGYKDNILWRVIADDRRSGVWLTKDDGLEFFNPDTGRSELITDFYKESPFALTAATFDNQGNLWLGSYANGLIKYNPDTRRSEHFEPSAYPELAAIDITTIKQTKDNEIWLGTRNQGILIFKNGKFEPFKGVAVKQNNIQPELIQRIVPDPWGNLWIASSTGAFVLSATAKAIKTIPLNQFQWPDKIPLLTGIAANDNGFLYISTSDGFYRLNLHQNAQKELTRLDNTPLPSHYFSGPYIAKSGQVYVCNSVSTYRLEQNRLELVHQDNIIPSCVNYLQSQKSASLLWQLSHKKGLIKLNQTTGDSQIVDLPEFSKRLIALSGEQDNKLWLSSADKGIAAWDIESGKIKIYQHDPDDNSTLPNNTVTDIIPGANESLWLATFNGLSHFTQNSERFTNYGVSQGLTSELLNEIIADNEGDIWISAQHGMNLFSTQTQTIRRFYQSNGLLDNEFNLNTATEDKQGFIYFAGINGISFFDPLALKQTKAHFNTFISQVSIDSIATSPRYAQLRNLAPSTKEISIDFGLTAYAQVATNSFRYYLEGYDESWREQSADTSATFSNLPFGDYTFYVQGRTESADWTSPAAKLHFTISTPYYLTPWAFVVYLVLLAFTVKLLGLYLTKAEKEKARRLQQQVDEQTISLQQSHEKLANLYQRQQWLFAQLSHEIRTPLTLMLAPFNRTSSGDEPNNTLSIAQHNQNRVVKMLDQLLDIAQSGNLNTEQTKLTVDIEASLNWVAGMLKPLFEQKQQTFIVGIEPCGYAELTKDALEKIMLNLLSNANKYTQSEGKITLSAKRSNNQVTITVADTGKGIAQSEQQNIFECFERGEETANQTGAGVGLAVVKQLVALNGGQISLISEAGKGSSFVVTFDVTSRLEASSQFEPGKSVKSLTEQMLQGEAPAGETNEEMPAIEHVDDKPTILLAEDHSQMRDFIASILQPDFNLIVAEDGKQALEKAIEFVPEVIISDVMMPVMDGFELLQHIKQHPVTNHIPLMLLTARDDKFSRLQGLRLKADDYIPKPFDAQVLQLKIENMLNLQTMWHLRYQQLNENDNISEEAALTSLIQPAPALQSDIDRVRAICLEHYQDNTFKVDTIAEQMNMTQRQLQRKIKTLSGLTPMQILRDIRLQQAKLAIEAGEQITQVAYSCGFSGYDHFSRSFKEKFGQTPKQCQQKNSEPN